MLYFSSSIMILALISSRVISIPPKIVVPLMRDNEAAHVSGCYTAAGARLSGCLWIYHIT